MLKFRGTFPVLCIALLTALFLCPAETSQATDPSDCLQSEDSREEVSKDNVRTTGTTFANIMRGQSSRLFAPAPTQVGLLDSRSIEAAEGDSPEDMSSGLASGDDGSSFGTWIAASRSFLQNTDNDLENGRHDFTGEAFLIIAGIDFPLTENFIPGLAIGYEGADLETDFNDGDISSSGITISPYAAYAITDNWVLSAAYGYTPMHTETRRDKSQNYSVEGDYDSRRDMFTADLTYQTLADDWSLSGFIGQMYANEAQQGFVESRNGRVWHTNHSKDIFVGQLQIGGRAGYLFKHAEPYLGLAYLYDYTMSATEDPDRDEVELTAGVNIFSSDTLSLGAEVRNSFLREDVKSTSLMLNIRLDF